MADEDGYAMMEDFEFDWLYVEDDFPLSDELAEMQIPDPGYAGTNYEIEVEHAELDWIDYWDECEYMDDEYWDNAQLGALATKPTAKRKGDEIVKELPEVKRRRVVFENIQHVKYISMAEQLERYSRPPPSLGNVKSLALLPDWRKRFANSTGVIVEKAMPEAMKKAAEAQDEAQDEAHDEDTPPKKRQFDALVEEGHDEEWMDEDEGEDEDEGMGDIAAQLASLDRETLKTVLKQKLGDQWAEGMDEMFMSTIDKMLSGGEGAEDAAGELASVLLGQATQGNDSAVSGWLSQQGVSLEEAEDDDASSVATTELPTSSAKALTSNVEVSPPDSAIEIQKEKTETRQMAMHGSSPSASGKKRAAPPDAEDNGSLKRKKVAFDVPASSQPPEIPIVENGEAETHNDIVAPEVEQEAEPTTSDDPLMSETTIQSTTTKTISKPTSAKAAIDKTVKRNGSTSAPATSAKNYAKPTATASAKQSRKRKAEADEDDAEAGAGKQKRPARKAAKSEPETPAVEPAARRTRSARAKAGK